MTDLVWKSRHVRPHHPSLFLSLQTRTGQLGTAKHTTEDSGLEPGWNRFGHPKVPFESGLELVWNYLGIEIGICLGKLWVQFGIGLRSVRGKFGIGLGSVWDRFGPDLGSVWGPSRFPLKGKKRIVRRSLIDLWFVGFWDKYLT